MTTDLGDVLAGSSLVWHGALVGRYRDKPGTRGRTEVRKIYLAAIHSEGRALANIIFSRRSVGSAKTAVVARPSTEWNDE
jgi:hypothetical protein